MKATFSGCLVRRFSDVSGVTYTEKRRTGRRGRRSSRQPVTLVMMEHHCDVSRGVNGTERWTYSAARIRGKEALVSASGASPSYCGKAGSGPLSSCIAKAAGVSDGE